MRRARGQAGSAVVELALVTPLIILLLLGAMDFGRVFYKAMAVSQAVGAGARYGARSVAKSGDTAGMQSAATTAAASDITGGESFVVDSAARSCRCYTGTEPGTAMGLCSSSCGGTVRAYVSVTGHATFSTIVNYPGIPHTLALSRTATLRVQ